MREVTIALEDISLIDFLGVENQNIKKIASFFPECKIISRGNEIKILGTDEEISKLKSFFEQLIHFYQQYSFLSVKEIEDLNTFFQNNKNKENGNFQSQFTVEDGLLFYGHKGIPIRAKTVNQKKLIQFINRYDIVFAVGSAGTGKTYTAVAIALKALKNKEIKRIIITRPAVEAGENLGFLPGDLKEKIDPYLRPVYDALDDMVEAEKLKQYLENRIIEIAPLAYMRGRTLSHSFIILDEAQNATENQIKMFLTRMGVNSKVIITGDLTQIDLPHYQKSGLVHSLDLLKNVDGISTVTFTAEDGMRHRLVKDIVKAYENIKPI